MVLYITTACITMTKLPSVAAVTNAAPSGSIQVSSTLRRHEVWGPHRKRWGARSLERSAFQRERKYSKAMCVSGLGTNPPIEDFAAMGTVV